APLPSITSLGTSSGGSGGGTSVTITGNGFTGASGVTVGGVPAASFTFVSDTSLTFVTPPHSAGTWDVVVSTFSRSSPLPPGARGTFATAAAAAVSGVSPTSGSTAGGTSVTISGSGFTGASAVSFGGVAAAGFTINSATQITATAPPQAAGTVDVIVTTPSGTSVVSAADHFTYNAAPLPAVTGVSPNTGTTAGGTSVTITGSNFTAATAVTFGTVPAAGFTVVSATQITATAPPQATGVVDVTVTTPSGTSATSAADHFTYTAAPPPSVSGITPSTGRTAGGP